jgi:Phospholipase_D-nuclease N-terminal
VDWTFGTFLWSMLVFFFWFAFIWMFIALMTDVLRRDISGWAKAGWIILMLFLPLIGILAYLIARPKGEQVDMYGTVYGGPRPERPRYAAEEIAKAAELRDQGRITAAEYEHLKHQALSY